MDTNKKKETSPDSFDDIDQKIHANQVLYDQLHQSLIDEVISTRRLVHIMRAYSIFNKKEDAIKYSINRFDDETKQAFLELYDKIDVDFQKED